MTRRKLKGTCLLAKFEPRNVKNALDNESLVEAMNEEIELDIEVRKEKELVLAKYVRRHHAPDQIVGDKSVGTMTRRKLKGTCFLVDFEPINVRNALDNDSCVEAMNEEIGYIEEKRICTLVPRPKDKNIIGIQK